MGVLTFDSDRLVLLRRALEDLSRRLESSSTFDPPPDMAHLVRAASEIVRLQITRVESSLRNIDRIAPARSCVPVEDAAARYRQWVDSVGHWWTSATTHDATESDEILNASECPGDPSHAGRLIDALPEIEFLVLGTADLTRVENLWKQATDPTSTPPAVAGERILRLLEVVFGDRPWERGLASGSIDAVERSKRDVALRELAARVVAPWQLHLTASIAGWNSSRLDGAGLLHRLSELESASDILLKGLPGALRHSLSELPADRPDRLSHIDSVALSVGTALEVRRLSQVRRAEESSGLDALRNVIGTLALDGPLPISLLVDAGARWLGDYLDTSDERIRQATLEQLTNREILATMAVLSVFASAVARHRARDSSDSPGDRQERADLGDELRHTYQSIDNAAGRGQSLAQLATGR